MFTLEQGRAGEQHSPDIGCSVPDQQVTPTVLVIQE